MQTETSNRRPLQADGLVRSSRLAPHYILDIGVRRKNLLDCACQTRDLRSGVYLFEQFLNNRCVWFREAQEYVIIPVLVTAPNS